MVATLQSTYYVHESSFVNICLLLILLISFFLKKSNSKLYFKLKTRFGSQNKNKLEK